jgi:ribosomal protein S18 acetylase RimI-like enzyme
MSEAPVIDFPDAAGLAADADWWGIYDASFPAAEREPREVILRSVERGVGMAGRARLNGATVGLATTHLLVDPPAVFLVYLAVAPGRRGGGLGARLVDEAWSSGARRLRGAGREAVGLVAEIDPVPRGADDLHACVRRVSFFERLGFEVVSRDYAQPGLYAGAAAVPMWLLCRRAGASALPEVGRLVRAIYREKYGAVNGLTSAT